MFNFNNINSKLSHNQCNSDFWDSNWYSICYKNWSLKKQQTAFYLEQVSAVQHGFPK